MSFLTLTVVVTHGGLDGADHLARTLVHQPGHPLLRSSMEAASVLGGQPGQITVVVLGSTLLWRGRRRWALSLPIAMAGAGLLQFGAKWAVDRPRPTLDPQGFPSAHVLSLVVLAGFITYVVATSTAQPRWRRLSVGICPAVVGTVAYSRLYLDAHWLSDVLGGLSLGLAYLLGVIWLMRSPAVLFELHAVRVAVQAGHGPAPPPIVAVTEAPTTEPLVVATAGS